MSLGNVLALDNNSDVSIALLNLTNMVKVSEIDHGIYPVVIRLL